MGSSSDRLFNRQRTVHQILGGGFDVILWRHKNLTAGILVVALAAWVLFEKSGYTLVSLVSSVFLLLLTILFLRAKSAAILNRYEEQIDRYAFLGYKKLRMSYTRLDTEYQQGPYFDFGGREEA